MSRPHRTTFSSDFRRFFWRGMGILLPSILTLWLIVQAYLFIERQIAEPINRGIRGAVVWVVPRTIDDKNLPAWFRVTPEEIARYRATEPTARDFPDEAIRSLIRQTELKRYWDNHWYFRFIGLAVAIILIYLAGLLLGGFLGRQLYGVLEERLLRRIPIVKQVYPHVKQVVDLILGERSMAFKRVVLVQYPSPGLWTIGFVTGPGVEEVSRREAAETLNVFVPSTPTPFTGFTITLRTSEVMSTSMTVDEALRFVITGGVLMPGVATSQAPAVPEPRAVLAQAGTRSAAQPPRPDTIAPDRPPGPQPPSGPTS